MKTKSGIITRNTRLNTEKRWLNVPTKAYRDSHKEQIKKHAKKYKESHKEEISTYQKAYRISHGQIKDSIRDIFTKEKVKRREAKLNSLFNIKTIQKQLKQIPIQYCKECNYPGKKNHCFECSAYTLEKEGK